MVFIKSKGAIKRKFNIREIVLASLPYFFMPWMGLVIMTLFPQICSWI